MMSACRITSPGFVPLFSAKGTEISALFFCGVVFFFFFFAESLQLTSLEVWRMACLSWDLLVRAAFVLPFPFCLAGFCDPLSFTGPNVVIAVSFCAGSPSQETAASLLPECFSRVCGLEGILQPGSTAKREFQPAGGRFITFAVC